MVAEQIQMIRANSTFYYKEDTGKLDLYCDAVYNLAASSLMLEKCAEHASHVQKYLDSQRLGH